MDATLARRAGMEISGFSIGDILNNRCRGKSMMRSCLKKKSDPRIGLETSASLKGCSTQSPVNWSLIWAVPKVRIDDPLAARSFSPSGLDLSDAGNTEISAPVSTRNAFLDLSSQTDRVPDGAAETILIWLEEVVPGATAARRGRFPTPA